MKLHHILIENVNGNPNIGLYGYCNNEYCLVGTEVKKSTVREIEKVLKVPVHQITLCGTSLIGVFAAGIKESNLVLLPSIVFDYELDVLNKLRIPYKIIEAKLTALGNNILCNEHGCLVNPDFTADQKKRIRQALGVRVVPGTIAELSIVGSLAVANDKVCIIDRDVLPEEMSIVESLLKIKGIPATVNMGFPHIKSGLLCNRQGFIIGDHSGGPEITHIDEALGFIE